MDCTFSCFGLAAAFHIQRQGTGSHLLRVPEHAVATRTLQATPPSSSREQARRWLERYQGAFWKHDPGYRFAADELPRLLPGRSTPLFDVGCNVGQFVAFAEAKGLRSQLAYHGVDADSAAIEVAREAWPDAQFTLADAMEPLEPIFTQYPVVYSKGMLCSVPHPLVALRHVLACAERFALLIHTACTEDACGEPGYATTLYANSDNAYLFTIMETRKMLGVIEEAGFVVRAHVRRSHVKNVMNLGTYRLHDLVLERVSSIR